MTWQKSPSSLFAPHLCVCHTFLFTFAPVVWQSSVVLGAWVRNWMRKLGSSICTLRVKGIALYYIIYMGLSENRVYSQWNSHLIGIRIMNTIGFRGTLFSDTPISKEDSVGTSVIICECVRVRTPLSTMPLSHHFFSSKTTRRTWWTSTKLLGKHGLVALAVEAVTQGIVLVRVVRLKLGISWGMGGHHVPKPPGDTSKFQTSIACSLTCQERLAGHHSIFWWYPKAWPISIKQACHMCRCLTSPLLTVEAQLRELVQKPGQGALSRWMSTEEFHPYFRAEGTHGMEVFLIGKIWQDSTTIRHWEP